MNNSAGIRERFFRTVFFCSFFAVVFGLFLFLVQEGLAVKVCAFSSFCVFCGFCTLAFAAFVASSAFVSCLAFFFLWLL